MENISLEILNNKSWLQLCELLQPEGPTVAEFNLLTSSVKLLNPTCEPDKATELPNLLDSLEDNELTTLGNLLDKPKVQLLLLISSDTPMLTRYWIKIRSTRKYECAGETKVLLVLDNITEAYKSELNEIMFLG